MEGKDEVPILDLMESAIEAGPAVRNNGEFPPRIFVFVFGPLREFLYHAVYANILKLV